MRCNPKVRSSGWIKVMVPFIFNSSISLLAFWIMEQIRVCAY
uniref:Uncharacterized protein n=1 Tax=Arundo donax TaxID=35708 RepID=A0A0A9EM12_ARUDO